MRQRLVDWLLLGRNLLVARARPGLRQPKVQLRESHSIEVFMFLCVLLLIVLHHHGAFGSHVGHEADLIVQVAVDPRLDLDPTVY